MAKMDVTNLSNLQLLCGALGARWRAMAQQQTTRIERDHCSSQVLQEGTGTLEKPHKVVKADCRQRYTGREWGIDLKYGFMCGEL